MNDSISGFFLCDVYQRVSPAVVSDGLDEVVLDGVAISEIRKQFHFSLWSSISMPKTLSFFFFLGGGLG